MTANTRSGTYETERLLEDTRGLRDELPVYEAKPLVKTNSRIDASKDRARARLAHVIAVAWNEHRISERAIARYVGMSPAYLREMRLGTREVPEWLFDEMPDELRECWLIQRCLAMPRESRARIARAVTADDVAPLSTRRTA